MTDPDPALVDAAARALAEHRAVCPGGRLCETCRELAAEFRRALRRTLAGRITTTPPTG